VTSVAGGGDRPRKMKGDGIEVRRYSGPSRPADAILNRGGRNRSY
jgi:hypothetical protein